jgi:hypothetical protein
LKRIEFGLPLLPQYDAIFGKLQTFAGLYDHVVYAGYLKYSLGVLRADQQPILDFATDPVEASGYVYARLAIGE